jgi:acyl carrier protein
MKDTLTRLQEQLRNCGSRVPTKNVEPSSRLTELGIDSLDVEELVMMVEEEFGLEISHIESQSVKNPAATVQDWVDFIDARL